MIHGPTSETATKMARQEKLTEEDIEAIEDRHWTGDLGHFNGYRYYGYIGSGQRNYITDEWLLKAANELGWDREMLDTWMCSKYGRWLLDHQPRTYKKFREELEEGDSWVREEVQHE